MLRKDRAVGILFSLLTNDLRKDVAVHRALVKMVHVTLSKSLVHKLKKTQQCLTPSEPGGVGDLNAAVALKGNLCVLVFQQQNGYNGTPCNSEGTCTEKSIKFQAFGDKKDHRSTSDSTSL